MLGDSYTDVLYYKGKFKSFLISKLWLLVLIHRLNKSFKYPFYIYSRIQSVSFPRYLASVIIWYQDRFASICRNHILFIFCIKCQAWLFGLGLASVWLGGNPFLDHFPVFHWTFCFNKILSLSDFCDIFGRSLVRYWNKPINDIFSFGRYSDFGFKIASTFSSFDLILFPSISRCSHLYLF